MRFIQIRLWFLILILLSLPVAFLAGMILGKTFEEGQKSATVKFIKAIESGKSVTVGDFVLTPCRQWTKENPVTYIWKRKSQLPELTIVDRKHDDKMRVRKE